MIDGLDALGRHLTLEKANAFLEELATEIAEAKAHGAQVSGCVALGGKGGAKDIFDSRERKNDDLQREGALISMSDAGRLQLQEKDDQSTLWHGLHRSGES